MVLRRLIETTAITGIPQLIYEIPMDVKVSAELADLDFAKMLIT